MIIGLGLHCASATLLVPIPAGSPSLVGPLWALLSIKPAHLLLPSHWPLIQLSLSSENGLLLCLHRHPALHLSVLCQVSPLWLLQGQNQALGGRKRSPSHLE